MLMVTGTCRYTLRGLEALLAPMAPVMLPGHLPALRHLQCASFLLMVSGPGRGLTDLLKVAVRVRQAGGGGQVALLGTPEQAAFLAACGVRLSLVVPLDMPLGRILPTVSRWLTGHHAASGPKAARFGGALSVAEHSVLQSTLSGIPVALLGDITGLSVKTLYCHRRSALGKLGVRSIQELLARPDTGIPSSPSRCARLLRGSLYSFPVRS